MESVQKTCNHKFNNHRFRKKKRFSMQENFIFLDTEANEEIIDEDTKNLTFKMGTSIIWNRILDKEKRFVFYDIKKFWNEVENSFDGNHKQFILFAHNINFDFKMINGFNSLNERGWLLDNHYVRNRISLFVFKKEKYILHVWDTNNYFIKSFTVEQIGESIGYPKLKVDFKHVSKKDLEIYCMRDTEILYQFIKRLITFLIEKNLSKLKATASSLSFSTYCLQFYDEQRDDIYIHDWKKAIQLERESYRGGITDVFQLGKHEDIIKSDVNSHYPKAMKDLKLPTKLHFYSHASDKFLLKKYKECCDPTNMSVMDLTNDDFQKIKNKLGYIYDKVKKEYGVIARVKINLPKKYAYILYDFGLGKTSFAWGNNMEVVLCTPELNFVEKYGQIVEIIEMNVYEVKQILKEFVEFFYDLKKYYDETKNKVNRDFSKLMLNGNYGKWGQKNYERRELTLNDRYLIENQDLILDILQEKQDLIKKSSFVYLGSINSKELYVIDKKLYLAYNTNENSKESFVAISSFITSQARMNLIEYLLIAERKNVLYCDTDSLFITEKGYQNLLEHDCIDDFELGKLKIEGTGIAQFYNPKFYDFTDYDDMEFHRKCKGIKQKNSELIEENNNFVKYKIEQWDKFKSSMKKGNFTNQLIRMTYKVMSKKYNKGIVMKNGFIEPYHISQINALHNL